MFVVWAAMSVYLHFVITFDKTIWYFWLCFLFGAFRILCVPKYRVTFRVVPPLAHVLHKQHNLWVFDCCSFANIFLFSFPCRTFSDFSAHFAKKSFPTFTFFLFCSIWVFTFFSIRFLCSVNFFFPSSAIKNKRKRFHLMWLHIFYVCSVYAKAYDDVLFAGIFVFCRAATWRHWTDGDDIRDWLACAH